MKRRLLPLLFVIMLMLASTACKKNEIQNDAKDDTEVTNEDTSQEEEEESASNVVKTVVNSDRYFDGIVEATTDEQQYFLLREDIVLDGRDAGFNGSDVTVDSNGERVKIIMSGTGGFYFEGFTTSAGLKESSQMTFKNVDFVNSKGTGSSRENCYVYAYAENVIYENCTFDGGVVVYGHAKFVDCTFVEEEDLRYCIFVDNEFGRNTRMNVEIENCTFDGKHTAYGLVKVADDSEVGASLKVADCTFSNISNRPAVYVNGCTDVTTKGSNTYTDCTAGAIHAKGERCTLNGESMKAGTSYEK